MQKYLSGRVHDRKQIKHVIAYNAVGMRAV